MYLLLLLLLIPVIACSYEQGDLPLRTEAVVTKLSHPWGMTRLPNGDLLVTERSGRLQRINPQAKTSIPISGLPPIAVVGQGGLLDVVADPDFTQNRWIYFSYAAGTNGLTGTEVARAKLEQDRLTDLQTLFVLQPKSRTGHHFGSRLAFDNSNHLFISVGDRGDKSRAQDLTDHAGSIIRINRDGTIPADNPFVDRGSHIKPEIYSYGHRNPQGMVFDSVTNRLWVHEHGPQGGDELNLVEAGKNYGWPVITYGVNYGSGTKIGEGSAKAGMEQPVHYWVPSIAPSGMAIYRGSMFPQWQDDLLLGALKFQLLVRLDMQQDNVVLEQRYLQQQLGRIRDVEIATDGAIYLLTDEQQGGLYRVFMQ